MTTLKHEEVMRVLEELAEERPGRIQQECVNFRDGEPYCIASAALARMVPRFTYAEAKKRGVEGGVTLHDTLVVLKGYALIDGYEELARKLLAQAQVIADGGTPWRTVVHEVRFYLEGDA